MAQSDENYQLAHTPEFRCRVEMLLLQAAINISGEQPLPGGTYPQSGVTKRADLCLRILTDLSQTEERRFTNAICSLGSLKIDSTDQVISNAIASVFNDLAGCEYADLNE